MEVSFKENLFSKEETNFLETVSSLTGKRGDPDVGLWEGRASKVKRATHSNLVVAIQKIRAKEYFCFTDKNDSFYVTSRTKDGKYFMLKFDPFKKTYQFFDDVNDTGNNFGGIFSAILVTQIFSFAELRSKVDYLTKSTTLIGPEFEEMLLLACDMHYFAYGKDFVANVEYCGNFDEFLTDSTFPEIIHPIDFNNSDTFDSKLLELRGFIGKVSFAPHVTDDITPIAPAFASDKPLAEKNFLLYEEALSGALRIRYDWGEFSHLVVPLDFLYKYEPDEVFEEVALEVKFVLNRVLERLEIGFTGLDAINGCDIININLFGKAGVGKTTLVKAISAAFGLPLSNATNSEYTDESEFEGKTKIVDGKPSFVHTSFLERFKNGGIIVNEEVVLTLPAVLQGALGQAVIEPFILKENGYKDVYRHPLCLIFNIFNVGDEGGKQLPANFSSRFSPYKMDDASVDDIAVRLAKSQYGLELKDDSTCKKIAKVYYSILTLLNGEDINRPDIANRVTYRQCEQILRKILSGVPFKIAINTFTNKIAETDYYIADDIKKAIATLV